VCWHFWTERASQWQKAVPLISKRGVVQYQLAPLRVRSAMFSQILQKGRFWAASLASVSSMLNDESHQKYCGSRLSTDAPVVFSSSLGFFENYSAGIGSHVDLSNMPKDRERERERQQNLTFTESGGCWVIWRIWSFLTKSNQRMSRILRRHHWSAAPIFP